MDILEIMYITYIQVSKSTPLAVTGPREQLTSLKFFHFLVIFLCCLLENVKVDDQVIPF